MIFVDSSVWIDFFRGTSSAPADFLDRALFLSRIVIGDLVLAEVLQGFNDDAELALAERHMTALTIVNVGGRETALDAARNFRALRRKGVTVRGTIDALIATYCLRMRLPLLFSDRDFDPFVEHLGLVSAMARTTR